MSNQGSRRRHWVGGALLVTALLAPAGRATAQVDYARAEQMLSWNTERLITGGAVSPEWYPDGNRFWYRTNTHDGYEFVRVDPVRNRREPVFDRARLAAAMSLAGDTAYAPNKLPFRSFKFGRDGKDEGTIEFNASRKRFVCDLGVYRCSVGDTLPSEDPYVKSPDRRWEAFIHAHDVYVRPAGGGDSVRLTHDGEELYSYGITAARPNQLVRGGPRRPQIKWSPDSKKLVVQRSDERNVAQMHYISATHQRPKLYSQPYALPGDSVVPLPGLHIIDIERRTNLPITLAPRPNQLSFGSARDSTWSKNSDKVHVSWITRGSKAGFLGEVDAQTGNVHVLAADSSKTFVEIGSPQDPTSWYVADAGNDVIWWSERDGWAHLYRYDRSGTLKNQITSGAWFVSAVQHVDEGRRQIYFTARGREPGRQLYYAHLYRVNFDGSGLTLLTREDAHHEIAFAPSGRYFVDSYSRIEEPPVSVLRSVPDGRILRTLEKADISRLKEAGWQPATVFEVKARDGVTNLYGVMYLPPNLDPTKKYPVVNHIYPGPQVGSVGQWSFKGGGEPHALAQLGFVVIQLDHLGTPLRSKAFHDNYYGAFNDNGLPDHVTAIKQLAARFPFMDLDRVGIFGHSGGGFASTAAMFRYPDFFKVAVSTAGNHDNRSYNIYWAEKYQGLLQPDTLRKTDNFALEANRAHVKNLRGRLFLMHGDMDDNVHPAMTMQVVDELIKANKTFDLLILPNRAHGLNEPYVIRRRWDYFVEHLLGATPPHDYEIVRPEGS